jgi:hypothetical protein
MLKLETINQHYFAAVFEFKTQVVIAKISNKQYPRIQFYLNNKEIADKIAVALCVKVNTVAPTKLRNNELYVVQKTGWECLYITNYVYKHLSQKKREKIEPVIRILGENLKLDSDM